MPHVEPGGALELAPAATDGTTVRWRQFAGPAAAWGQDRDGNAVNVRLSGGFKADPRYPETLDWSTTP